MAEINTSIQLDVKSVIVIVFVVVKNIYFGFKKEKEKKKKLFNLCRTIRDMK